jgi:hypothetical protein
VAGNLYSDVELGVQKSAEAIVLEVQLHGKEGPNIRSSFFLELAGKAILKAANPV